MPPDASNQTRYFDWMVHQEVAVDKVWQVRFNQQLDNRSVTEKTVWMESEDGQSKVGIRWKVSNGGKTLEIAPVSRLNYDMDYVLYIQNLYSQSGAPLKQPIRMRFRTVGN